MSHANLMNNYFNPNSVYTEKDFRRLFQMRRHVLECPGNQSILSTEARQRRPPWFLTSSEGYCCTSNDGLWLPSWFDGWNPWYVWVYMPWYSSIIEENAVFICCRVISMEVQIFIAANVEAVDPVSLFWAGRFGHTIDSWCRSLYWCSHTISLS